MTDNAFGEGLAPDGSGADAPAVTPTRVLFVPAFNELAGYDVRKIVADPFSPVSRCLKRETVEILLADGTLLGPIEALEPFAEAAR